MPSIDRIAKTINGPNEAEHVGAEKLRELQDTKWGQLKSQDQAYMLRAARFVALLYEQEGAPVASNGAPVTSRPPPLPKTGPATPPPLPDRVLECDQRSIEHLLQQFRAFVSRNATQWLTGSQVHPMWQDVATELDMYDLNFTSSEWPDYEFIQPGNRRPYTELLAEYVNMHNERDATDRGG